MNNKRYICFFLSLICFFSILNAQQKAEPKTGEGVSTFLLRYNRAPKKYYDDFVKLNKGKLGKDGSLKLGMSYTIPPVKSNRVSEESSTSSKTTQNRKSDKKAIEKKEEQLDDSLDKSKKGKLKSKSKLQKKDEAIEEDKNTKKGKSKSKRQKDDDVVEEEKNTKKEKSKRKNAFDEPLFGSPLLRVRADSHRLDGACFYVVSGHGGPDPGAIGKIGDNELHEDEYAYDIALRLAYNLMKEGAEVRIIIQDKNDGIRNGLYLNNSKDETCMGNPIPLNQVERLKQRCQAINTLYHKDRKNYKYCRAIFIHIDSRSSGKQTDVFFYHSARKAESKRLAYSMQEMFASKYDKYQPNRGFTGTVSERNLFVLANASPASVFVELGNIQNENDQRRLMLSYNREAVAKWLMEGFFKDFREKK